MNWQLARNSRFAGRPGPVVLVVLDGVGLGAGDAGDAVVAAKTPTLDAIAALGHTRALTAHGTAVGLPSDDDMGNSEVGHNALGAGMVPTQGAALVQRAIASGALMRSEAFVTCVRRSAQGGALHLLGLLSDGNVHAHIDHLIAMLRAAATAGVRRLFVHILLDGRDVAPTSALTYIEVLERELASLRAGGCEAAIASGGGRMSITMDRYEADWDMVARGWRTHVHGEARRFPSAAQAILTFRGEAPGIIDQDLPAFVIADADGGAPIAPMRDGDSVILFNFRGDRAIEITRAFEAAAEAPWAPFDRGPVPSLFFAGMMQYDGDLQLPRHYLVSPPIIEHTMGEYLARNAVPQLALSETQKFGHVTYFWNGNRSGMFDPHYETYVQIDSDRAPFDERPWMKCAEITDALITRLADRGPGAPRFVRVNYPNGDMVGHTGAFDATVLGIEAVDLQLARLQRAVQQHQGILVLTADHGNADEMYQRDKRGQTLRDAQTGAPLVKTSHSLAPVPFMIYDPSYAGEYALAAPQRIWRAAPPQVAVTPAGGLGHVAATCLELLGYQAPEGMLPSLLARR
ncbi:MAG: 2,3-bisphosphoglycerate-independent phosphoglycerate mutase [Myxococcales bacterium]|nr:2,3-bisphosphoglycerate-independent phosphoglycerate mutase [Myxococcales bacterium]